MAITYPYGFIVSSPEPIDSRIVLTKEEMVAMKKAKMPQVYFAICKDDGNLYLYNSANEIDEETGRFRLLQSGGSTDATDVKVSEKEGNIITMEEDGLYAECNNERIDNDAIKGLFSV